MNKSLSERIADHESKKMAGTKNKVTFLALRQDIAEALEKGWPLIAIWETLHAEGKITFTYNTFRLYVSKFLGSYMPVSNKKNIPEKRHNIAENQSTKKTTSILSFTFNPKPNLDELL